MLNYLNDEDGMKKEIFIIGIIVTLFATGLSGCLQDDSTGTYQNTVQIWELADQTGQVATLTVNNLGYFSGSGWVGGGSAGIQPYDIDITNGRMSSTSMTFDASASYDSGAGSISAHGIGTLNAPFPNSVSASGTWSGTISDPLGTRTFSQTWTATKISGGDISASSEDFEFDVDVNPHIATIKQGEIAVVNITVRLVRGTPQPVALTTTEWESALEIYPIFAKTTVTPTETTMLYIETTCDTPPDEYLFTVRGEEEGSFHTSVDSVNIKVVENSDCSSTLPPEVPQKPTSLLATDAEYYSLYITFENWGFDFYTLYNTYSEEGFVNNWGTMWIGSAENENQRAYFDRVGDKWKPRAIPT